MLIHPYKPSWKVQFETIQEILRASLSQLDIQIEHIGSTSVLGLAAKPIIDIDIVYHQDDQLGSIIEALSSLGYYHNGDQGIPHREAFKRPKDVKTHEILDSISHHLYACPSYSEELARHLAFRDYLRKHQAAREEYQSLKQQIAAEAKQDRKVYAQLKETRARGFVLGILEKAGKE